MNSLTLFSMALGLQSSWQVNDISFSEPTRKELHLQIGFVRGSRFPDETGVACPVHDTVEREWQHLNFFEHHCFLHCAVPRITTSNGRRPYSFHGRALRAVLHCCSRPLRWR